MKAIADKQRAARAVLVNAHEKQESVTFTAKTKSGYEIKFKAQLREVSLDRWGFGIGLCYIDASKIVNVRAEKRKATKR